MRLLIILLALIGLSSCGPSALTTYRLKRDDGKIMVDDLKRGFLPGDTIPWSYGGNGLINQGYAIVIDTLQHK